MAADRLLPSVTPFDARMHATKWLSIHRRQPGMLLERVCRSQ